MGALVAGIVAAALPDGNHSSVQRLQAMVLACAQASAAASEVEVMAVAEGNGRSVQAPDWRVAYNAMMSLERIVLAHPQLLVSDGLRDLLVGGLPSLLLFSHAWVRVAASRLLGAFPGVCNTRATNGPGRPTEPLTGAPRLCTGRYLAATQSSPRASAYAQDGACLCRLLAASCRQLADSKPSPALSDQAARNLLALLVFTQASPDACPGRDDDAAQPLRALFGKAGAEVDVGPRSERAGEGPDERAAEGLCWGVYAVLRRLAARCREVTARKAILRLFGALGAQWTGGTLDALARIALKPLVYAEGDTKDEDDSGGVVSAVLRLLQERLGDDLFFARMAAARGDIAKVRQVRSAQRALEAVTDPLLAERRREEKYRSKRDAAKRKAKALYQAESAGGALGVKSRRRSPR